MSSEIVREIFNYTKHIFFVFGEKDEFESAVKHFEKGFEAHFKSKTDSKDDEVNINVTHDEIFQQFAENDM